MEKVDCAVIGAGVIGLAVARAMALQGRDVIVLESEDAIGTQTSARNSEVIHAGIYYPKGSLKARLCVAGKKMLYAYCQDHGINHKRCGKLIVATNDVQSETLNEIMVKAAINGVDDMERLDRKSLLEMEPALNGVAALLSPSTGLIDTHGLMLGYQGDAEAKGAMIAFLSPVTGGEILDSGEILLNTGGGEAMSIACSTVINCAGLQAQQIAASIKGMPADHVPETHYAKGNYFTLAGKAPFGHLIYPVPEEGGLGVHLTLDLAGQARFGPDVEWIEEINYDVDPRRGDKFYAAVRSYWPDLKDDALQPGFSGIRPKLLGPGNPASDFVVSGPADHGVQGLVNLFGIESPGITASLGLAGEVQNLLM